MSITIGSWKGTSSGVLAPRELEGVLHCANSLTVKEAAKIMGISPDTLKKRLDSARFKLEVSSIRALVLEAFRRQIISPVAIGLIALVAAHAIFDDEQGMRNRRSGERRIEQRSAGRRVEEIRLAA